MNLVITKLFNNQFCVIISLPTLYIMLNGLTPKL